MEKAKLAVLSAELKKQKQEIDKIYLKLKRRESNLKSEAGVESLAYQLHNLYCAYEDFPAQSDCVVIKLLVRPD